MPRISHILIFLVMNALGFLMAPICFYIGIITGAVAGNAATMDPLAVKTLVTNVTLTWMICAVFSIGSFFMRGASRVFFLLAPVVVPLAYGLRLLFFPL